MKKLYFPLIACVSILMLSSCVKHHNIDVPEDDWHAWFGLPVENSVVKGGTVTTKQVAQFIGETALTKKVKYTADEDPQELEYDTRELTEKLKYDVDFYHMSYYTQYGMKGSTVRNPEIVYARTLLLVPKGIKKEDFKVAVYCHGTVLPVPEITDLLDMGTPADFTGSNGSQDVRFCALPLASAGYVVICPEYTGYGPTAGKDHPFVYYPELIMSAYHAIAASFIAMNLSKYGIDLPFEADDTGYRSLPVNSEGKKDIYLCGWSQGGGLALYMQKMIENNDRYNYLYTVKATSTLAGPFNIEHFLKEMLQNPDKTYLLMALYGWAGYSINMFCTDLQRPMDTIFRPSIYDQTDAFILFGNTPNDLFQQFFRENILNGKDETFIQALKDDSTNEGWSPKAPVYLHHGAIDNVVPCFNSEDAFRGLKDSAQNGIHFYKYAGENHTTCVPTYMSHTIDLFSLVD